MRKNRSAQPPSCMKKGVLCMNNDTIAAKNSLLENGYTCVLCRGGTEYHSTLRGVKPLLDFLESGDDFAGFCAADKTVGAGAAHLYVLLGVQSVWANVISEQGRRILQQNNIAVFGEQVVPFIINRAGDGVCPIETAVTGIARSDEALVAIQETLQKLKSSARG